MAVPNGASAAILLRSEPVPSNYVSVKGPDLEKSMTLQDFLGSYTRIGFQATSLGRAIDIVNRMASLTSGVNIYLMIFSA